MGTTVCFVPSWRNGFGIDRRAGAAPWLGIVVGAVGVALNSTVDDGDLRVGVFPWAMSLVVVCLALCCLGLLNGHAPTSNAWTVVGTWWTTAALLGIGGFFVAIGVGSLLGIDETEAGAVAIIPVVGMAFGLLSMTPALVTLAVGVGKAGKLSRWGRSSLWIAAPVLPLILVYGGAVEGTAETVGSAALLATFGAAWLVLGTSVLRMTPPSELVGQ